MESKEQGLKAKITRDLREGRVSRNLILLVLGEGGLRLKRNQLDVIFEWMVANPDKWSVGSDKALIVVFRESPFRPDCWSSLEDYKYVMRQMFGDCGTRDFLNSRCSMVEAKIISRGPKELQAPIEVNDYVVFNFEGVETLGMVAVRNADKSEFTVRILSGVARGMFHLSDGTELIPISPESAVNELARQKEEWKTEKRKQSQEAARIEFQNKYGNIVRGSYLKNSIALYMVESVDLDRGTAIAVRLVGFGTQLPAGKKCTLVLENGFRLVSATEVAEILLKEYE